MMDSKRVLVVAYLMLAGSIASSFDSQSPTNVAGHRRVSPPPTVPGGVYKPDAPLSDQSFYVHDLGHRCIDFGARDGWALSAPVYIYSCNGTVAQQVRVKEIEVSHDVELRVETLFCIGARGGQVVVGAPLELQHCNESPAQRFALDGDAILMGSQASGPVTRDFTIEPQNDYTPSRTPLVVGTREASDAEYFRFEAVDHSQSWPTTGFIKVSNEVWLDWALSLGWGTVIEIDDRQPLVLQGPFPKEIHAGVTVRGYRKYTYQGHEIRTCAAVPEVVGTFHIAEDRARFTGLRLRGPRTDPRCGRPDGREFDGPESQAIRIDPAATMRIWIDHLDIGYWNGSAVDVRAFSDTVTNQRCPVLPEGSNIQSPLRWCCAAAEFPREESVRAVANFIHHNHAYGVVTGTGGFVLDRANVFYGQRAHSVASDGVLSSGYHAYDNLVLITPTKPHDFDMHGTLHGDISSWYGGVSGDSFDIGWNTFVSTGHKNVFQRGTPCRCTMIHDSVFVQSESDAIETQSENLAKHLVFANTFSATPHPLADLAVADFDGDGVDDVFVGTGAAWYFSSGGQAEWRFLNRMPEHASSLLFGDFDGDGRADAIALHNGDIDVSWGGMSPWQTINATAWTMSDLAVGDIDGDGQADLFLATGAQWFYAPGARNWTPLHFSSYRTPDLRFGHFTHSGRTQVLRVSHGQWQTAELGLSWSNIGSAPASSTSGLVVGDFDGDGRDDVGRDNLGRWEYSSPGRTTGWTTLRQDSRLLTKEPVGRFDSDRKTDVILWNSQHFDYAPSGRNPVQRLSRQNMD